MNEFNKFLDNAEKSFLEDIKQNSWIIQFIKDQTEEMCLVAVENNGKSLQYIRDQTLDIIIKALEQNIEAKYYIKYIQLTLDEIEFLKLRFNI